MFNPQNEGPTVATTQEGALEDRDGADVVMADGNEATGGDGANGSHPGREAEMNRMLAELERLREAAQCKSDVADFVKPYLLNLLKRREEGKGIVTIAQYCREEKVCENCFHQEEGKQHGRFNCRNVCCGIRRCAKCFHTTGESLYAL